MTDHLALLATSAKSRVNRGYYDSAGSSHASARSLTGAIRACKTTPLITEIKFRSPSAGKIRELDNVFCIAKSMISGGACALSVLTDPDNFGGKLEFLAETSRMLPVPVVMKDIIVSPRQIRAASEAGGSAVVLISEIFTRGLAETRLENMLVESRRLGVEALVEANSPQEFAKIRKLEPDLYGINNRSLSTFQVDLSTTGKILAGNPDLDRPVVSESGIESAGDIRRLRSLGVSAFLVGTSIMKCEDVESKVRELANA